MERFIFILKASLFTFFLINNNVIGQFAGGTGTVENPFLISNRQQLEQIEHHLEAHFLQISDINLSGANWIPIGDQTGIFKGFYDGGGFQILNMHVSSTTNYAGLFRYVQNATIKNIIMTNFNIFGRERNGAIAGQIDDSFIENIYLEGEINSEHYYQGGLAGYINRSIVQNVGVNVEISGHTFIGGLTGYLINSEMYYSYSMGNINGRDLVGGLIGLTWGAVISDTYSHATVSGLNRIGGLIGSLGGKVFRSYSTGYLDSDEGSNVGGLVGLIGISGSAAYFSFWDVNTSGVTNSAGGNGVKGLTTELLMQIDTYTPFNFYSIWMIDNESTYPYFQDLKLYELPQPVQISDLSGDGSVQNPYIINNVHELNAIHQNINAHFILGNDIDASHTAVWNFGLGWTPLGTTESPFKGSLNGNGYQINGLVVNAPGKDKKGFVGVGSEATLSNIVFNNAHITGESKTGIAAGELIESSLEKISGHGKVVSISDNIGGIFGYLDKSIVETSTSNTQVWGQVFCGGLAGYVRNSDIRYSSSIGSLHAKSFSGGLAGYTWGSDIIDSFSHMHINAFDQSGGLVGSLGGQVVTSYSTGIVSVENSPFGGLIGLIGSVGSKGVNSFWNIETSGQTTSAGGAEVIGLNTVQMTYPYQTEVYLDWDFDTVWKHDESHSINSGYPHLGLVTATSIDPKVSDTVVSFELFQNYPNPFNPTTQIRYQIHESLPVKIEVFSITGQLVSTIVDGYVDRGTYSITFDGSKLSSGIYLYRISTTKLVTTKKMILIK